MSDQLDDFARNAPFLKAVQVACAKLGACALPCPFPRCECKLVPDAIRDAIHAWVHALPKGGTALPADGAPRDPDKGQAPQSPSSNTKQERVA